MGVLMGLLWPVEKFNTGLLAVARALATALLAVMVLVVVYQIVMRLISPVGWTIPAAKFMMLWMIGLAAPIAYRQGGFVGIDLLERSLPRGISNLLILFLLLVSGVVIVTCCFLGWNEVDSFTGKGTISGLKIGLGWLDMADIKFRNWYAFASLYLGMLMLALVNLELILRHLVTMAGGADALSELGEAEVMD